MTDLYKNPTTLGKTPTIEAYRIALCPTCAWPATSIIEGESVSGRTIACGCGRGHRWTTNWPGETRMITRQRHDHG
jgi:hypothetical protein